MMTEPGNSKSPEEINNQMRPHPSETFPNIAAQTLNITNSGEDLSSSKFRQQRYLVSTLVLASLMIATCLVQAMASSTIRTLQIVTLLCSLCLAFYIYQWVSYFTDGLTQRKRAYFDVRNVLLTYQPNKFTDKAALFHPDPPTPSVSAVPPTDVNNRNGQSSAKIKNMNRGEFDDWRNQHYTNEYTHAQEMARQQNQDRVPLYAPTTADGQDKIPPIPSVSAVPPTDVNGRNGFDDWRNQHYTNEYTNAEMARQQGCRVLILPPQNSVPLDEPTTADVQNKIQNGTQEALSITTKDEPNEAAKEENKE